MRTRDPRAVTLSQVSWLSYERAARSLEEWQAIVGEQKAQRYVEDCLAAGLDPLTVAVNAGKALLAFAEV
jgi:hypothetical protein